MLLKIEPSEITPFFYNTYFCFGELDFPLSPWLLPCIRQQHILIFITWVQNFEIFRLSQGLDLEFQYKSTINVWRAIHTINFHKNAETECSDATYLLFSWFQTRNTLNKHEMRANSFTIVEIILMKPFKCTCNTGRKEKTWASSYRLTILLDGQWRK